MVINDISRALNRRASSAGLLHSHDVEGAWRSATGLAAAHMTRWAKAADLVTTATAAGASGVYAFRSRSRCRCATPCHWSDLSTRVFAREPKGVGFDYVCVSSAGIVPIVPIPISPGYQVPFAARVRADAGIATRAVGLIAGSYQAETILWGGDADLLAFGRASSTIRAEIAPDAAI